MKSHHARLVHAAPALSILFLISPGCHEDTATETVVFTEAIPAYAEWEPNDDATTANDFGVLYPGDLFLIDGHSTDDGSDPFDGFSFVSGGPVHVDFRLFDEPYSSDLDVWLYDAQLDEVVGYFETENHPETGGVDVIDAGLEFHLLVTSYVGQADYSLEIAVSPLAPGLASTAQGSTGSAIRAQGTSIPGRERRADEALYVSDASAKRIPLARIEQSFDEESGVYVEVLQLQK